MDDFKFWNFTTFHKPSLFIPNLNFFLGMQSWICQNYSLPTEYIFLGRNEEYLLRRKKRKENPRSTICIHFMDIVFHSFGPLARLKKSHFLYFLFWISLLCCTLVCNIVEGDMKIILAKSVRLKWRLFISLRCTLPNLYRCHSRQKFHFLSLLFPSNVFLYFSLLI